MFLQKETEESDEILFPGNTICPEELIRTRGNKLLFCQLSDPSRQYRFLFPGQALVVSFINLGGLS